MVVTRERRSKFASIQVLKYTLWTGKNTHCELSIQLKLARVAIHPSQTLYSMIKFNMPDRSLACKSDMEAQSRSGEKRMGRSYEKKSSSFSMGSGKDEGDDGSDLKNWTAEIMVHQP